MTTNQFCTFHLDDQFFGVDVKLVQEVIRYQDMTEVPLAPLAVCGLINLRGQIVTAIDLRTKLGLPPREEGQLPMNVVIRAEDGPVSFLVDQIGDVIEPDEQSFELPPNTLQGTAKEYITGAYKLDHRLMLVLKSDEVIHAMTQ